MRKAYKFDLEVKGQHSIRIMNVHDTSSHCDTTKYAKYGKLMSSHKKVMAGHKTCQKPYKFDLKVKIQGCIWIMNVRDTLSHGNTPMSQIWLANVKQKKNYGLDTNLHRQTDRRTDGQTE